MAQFRVLIIEDGPDMGRLLRKAFEEENFAPTVAATGEEALRRLAQDEWELVLLDLMLPDMTGEDVLKFMSHQPNRAPVLVLTAKNRLEDKLSLFRQGCDDYLTKPFDVEELLERARALLRRSLRVEGLACSYEDLKLDPATYRLSTSEAEVVLTPKESAICHLLIKEPRHIISRREILRSVWGVTNEAANSTNFLGVHLLNLRKKFAQLGREEWLQTVRSAGVTLAKPEA